MALWRHPYTYGCDVTGLGLTSDTICNFSVLGDTRALLVKTDSNGILKVSQLSNDHTIDMEGEQQRLASLGLDVEKLYQLRKMGTSDCTRCIGDFHTKGGYKDIDILR